MYFVCKSAILHTIYMRVNDAMPVALLYCKWNTDVHVPYITSLKTFQTVQWIF